ncbi:MAG TPA: PilN domain-containing protein [Thermoanaerobaculia bacterium]|jgi:type IV pilus assembly protein PilN|nr:PilN domain-containing protein [Thermoanaerobaculia bacterium]
MIKINLLSEGKRAVRKAKPAASLLEGKDIGQYLIVAGLLIGALTSGWFWWSLKQGIADQQEEISIAQAEVEALGAVIKEVEEYKAKKAELERKIGIINDLKANQKGPVRIMDYVSKALPELLWMDRMTMNATTIVLEGRAFNTNAVAALIENLDRVPEFEEPTLRDATEQGGIYRFVIDFNYKFEAPKPEQAAGDETKPVVPASPATSG